MNKHSPKIFLRPSKVRAKFWTDHLRAKRDNLWKARKDFVINNNEATWQVYVGLRSEYKTLLRQVKHKAWKDFTTQTEDVQQMAKLVRSITKTSFQEIGLLSSDDRLLSPNESISLLVDTHFPGNMEADGLPGASNQKVNINFDSHRVQFIILSENCLGYK